MIHEDSSRAPIGYLNLFQFKWGRMYIFGIHEESTKMLKHYFFRSDPREGNTRGFGNFLLQSSYYIERNHEYSRRNNTRI